MKTLSRCITRTLISASQRLSVGMLTFLLSTSIFANPVLAPTGSQNVGNFTVQQTPTTTTINQTSQKAIINWQSFNIGSQEHTHFQQPTGGVALNRINPSQGVSQIYGRLTASGQIILVNPAGVFFGPGAYVNVGGLIATTANISDQDFLNNYYRFTKDANYNGAIINQGTIIAANNGLVALIGGAVSNTGMIQANMGRVVLASGDAFAMTFSGNDLVSFTVDTGVNQRAVDKDGKEMKNGVSNTGSIYANQILISAKDAAGVLDNVINMSGVAQTTGISDGGSPNDGEIILLGDTDNGIVNVSGMLSTLGDIGGNIKITGYNILIDNTATLNASGQQGGGNILIGGDYQGRGSLAHANAVVMHDGAKIYADAITSGNGGKVVLWSDQYTNANGYISAKGGSVSGNGGLVETSSKNILNVGNILVNTLAANGTTGEWLLDPYNITISSSATSGGAFGGGNPNIFTPSATANVLDSTINTNLGSANVTITTGGTGSPGGDAGDITVNNTANISWNNSNLLTLSAYRNISNAGTITSTGGGRLSLIANNSGDFAVGSGNGTVTNTGTLNINGAVNIYYNPTNYTTPVSYTNTGAGTLTAYMLVNTLTNLQDMNTNLLGNYALSKNIDATDTINWNSGAGFNPVGDKITSYDGNFDGQGFTISNLYINRNTNFDVGLFGESYGNFANVTFSNPQITGGWWNGNGALVGRLTAGSISNVTVIGGYVVGDFTATGGIAGEIRTSTVTNVHNIGTRVDNPMGFLGGVIGYLQASTLSYASNSGTVGHLNINDYLSDVGGIVGYSDYGSSVAPSTITNSYNTGKVYGTNEVGGIVGRMNGNPGFVGTISDSFNTGDITYNQAGGSIGGIIGMAQDINISRVYNGGNIYNVLDDYSYTGNGHAGGIIGDAQTGGSLVDSYNTGNIVLAAGTTGSQMGGLIGTVFSSAGNVYTFTNNYNSGNVVSTGVTQTGALIGRTFLADAGGLTITGNSYWDSNTSGQTNAIGFNSGAYLIGLNPAGMSSATTTNMKQMATFSGWNISNVASTTATPPASTWFIFEGTTRPLLMMEYNTNITSAHQLQLMATALDGNYTLASNIDLAAPLASTSDIWTGNASGFIPIGDTTNPFTGSFNGNNLTISNLMINVSDRNLGFFGTVDSTNAIGNVQLANVDIKLTNTNSADYWLGGLIGVSNDNAIVSNVSTSGSITSLGIADKIFAGGLIGESYATVSNSYSSATVVGSADAGGLVAQNHGIITSSYFSGDVSIPLAPNGRSVGGIAGWNSELGSITDSYNIGSVTGYQTLNNIGGIAGNNSGLINRTYNSGLITAPIGATRVGGIATAWSTSVTSNSFWDTDTSNQTSYGGYISGTVTNVTGGCFTGTCTNGGTANLSTLATYSGAGWDITSTPSITSTAPSNTWFIFNGGTRPMLMSEYSTSITNAHQLQLVGTTLGADYTLANDIDLTNTKSNVADVWGTGIVNNIQTGSGFVPIGDNDNSYLNHYRGVFNGQDYAISNLYINNTNPSSNASAALFTASTNLIENVVLNNPTIISVGPGYSAAVLVGNAGDLQNITINGGSVTTTSTMTGAVGGIAGFLTNDLAGYPAVSVAANLTVNNMTINGSAGYGVGGIIGYSTSGTLSNLTNNNSSVTGSGGAIGGLVGTLYSSTLSTSYNAGSITGEDYVGGVVGTIQNGSVVQNTYNVGTISSNSASPYIGGVAGNIDSGGSLITSYNSGNVLAPNVTNNSIGGLVGNNDGSITDSFWDSQTSGQPIVGVGTGSSSGVTAKTTAEMMQFATFDPLWSITSTASTTSTAPTNTWFIFEGGTRPMLMMEYNTNVTNAHQLQLMGSTLGATYTIGDDIDLSSPLNNSSEVWGTRSSINSGKGFVSIGSSANPFSGALDGQDYTINGLYIRNVTGNVGLFAYIESTNEYKNLHLTNVNINSTDNSAFIGGFAGQADGQYTIRNISTSGTITGANKAGGIVGFLGWNDTGGLVTDAFSTVTLSSLNDTGGIAGGSFGSTITQSYFGGSINNGGSATSAGGILGFGASGSTVTDSYNYGSVSSATYAGGIIGYTTGSVTVDKTYSTGVIAGGTNQGGGLVGSNNSSTISNSFWDADTSGQLTPVGTDNGTTVNTYGGCFTGSCTATLNASYLFGGTTYANLSALATFTTTLSGDGGTAWSMTATPSYTDVAPSNTWFIFAGNTRPLLTMENTSKVTNMHQLQMMAAALDGNYTLENNITFATVTAVDVWNTNMSSISVGNPYGWPTSTGFVPVGNVTNNFTGSFDGQNNTITSLFINRPASSDIGLFGRASATSVIENVEMYNPIMYGASNVGSIVGVNSGTLQNSNATSNSGGMNWIGGGLQVNNVDVRGGSTVGALVGYNAGTVTNSYSHVNLFGGNTGHIAGTNAGTITRSYATGSTFEGGAAIMGGIAGTNTAAGQIINSFYSGSLVAGYYSSYFGGLVGYNSGLISKSYNAGFIYPGFANSNIGGIAGYNDPTGLIINSYNTGHIIFGQGTNGAIGGVAGTNAGTITNTYTIGVTYYQHNPTGTESNGFVGNNSGTINNSFWDIGTSGYARGYASNTGTINGLYGGCFGNTTCNLTAITNATNAGGAPLDLTKLNTYTTGGNDWNMSSIWNIIPDQSYPYLRDFYSSTPRAISGYHPSLSRFQSVSLAYDNAIKDTHSTFYNGFSYFLEGNNNISGIDNSIADGAGVLVISNSGILANYATYAPDSGASISGVNGFVLTANTVTGGNSETNISLITPLTNSQIVATRGTLVNGNILFTGSGNNITITNGYSFATTAATPYSLDGNISVTNGNLTFNGTLELNMASASLTTNSSGNVYIYNTVDGNNNALTINTVGTTSAVTGVMSDLSAFTKSGSGILTLSGANTYSGSANVTSGVLIASNNDALGSSAAIINGGTLRITNGITIANALSLSGTGAAGTNGALDTFGTGTATASGAITLAGNTTIGSTTGGLLNITNTINGTTSGVQSLTLGGTGNMTLGNTVGVGTALNNLTANLAITLGGSAITTAGTQTFNNAVTLAGSPTLTSTGGNIGFASTINGTSSGAQSLTTNSVTGGVTFNSSVGNLVPLNTFTSTAGGTSITFNNAPTITTESHQIYNSFVSLTPGSPTTFVTTAGDITFNAVIGSGSGSDFANNQLITNAAGQLIFNSNVGSGLFQLSSVDLTAAGGIYFNNSTISTNSSQTYRSPVHLTGTVHFTNYLLGAAQFLSSIDGPGSFTSNFYSGSFAGTNPQVVTFSGAIGANTPLNNFNVAVNQSAGITFPSTVDASGAITITAAGGFFNATSTPPNVVFNGAVGSNTIPTSVSVTSVVNFVAYTPSITFNSTVNTSGALTLASICGGPICTLHGPTTLGGTVGTLANPVGSIAVTGSQINLNMDYAYSNGAQTYTGPVVLNAAGTTALISNSGDITASSTVTGNGSNTLLINNAGANSILSGVVDDLALVKSGAGRLILANNNTYTGGTTINTGILQVGNGGATGSITGDVTNTASLVFNTTSNISYSDIISGTGSVTKNSSGMLTLSGANTYSGGTTLNSGTLTIGANSTGSITNGPVGTGSLVLAGGTLQSSGAFSIANPYSVAGTATIGGSNSLTLSGAGTLSSGSLAVTNSANTITLSGNLSGSIALSKSGAGTLTVSGANNGSFSGNTTLTAGNLTIGVATNALGTGTLALNGGTLTTFLNGTLTNNYTVGGAASIVGSSFGNNSIMSGTGTLSSGSLQVGGSLELSGNLSGSAPINQPNSGNDVIIFSGANNSGYSGNISFIGALIVGSATNALGTGTLTFNTLGANSNISSSVNAAIGNNYVINNNGSTASMGGSFNLTMSGTGTLNNGQLFLSNNSGATLTLSGNLSGTGTITNNNGFSPVISGADNSGFTGTFNASTATTTIISSASNALGSGLLTINDGTIISTVPTTLGNSNITIAGAGAQFGGSNNISTSAPINFSSGALTVSNTATTTLSGNFSGSAALSKSGAGTLIISSANNSSFSGTTTLSGGTLQIGVATNALGTGSLALNGGTLQSSLTTTLANNFTMGATTTLGGANNLTFSGTGALNAGTLTITNSATTTLSGVLSGASGITFDSAPGTFILNNSNTYTGKTTVNAGTLNINSIANLSTASAIGAPTTVGNGTIDLGALGVLQYSGSGNSSNRVVNLTASGGTIDASGSGTLTLSGGVTGNTFGLVLTGTGVGTQSGIINTTSGALTKNGAGTWTLSGANTYSGGTTLNTGTLAIGVSSTGAITNGPIGTGALVMNGGTLQSSGSFSIANAYTVDGSVALGGTNNLTLSGAGTMTSGTLTNTNSAISTLSGILTGSTALTQNGSGILTISGADNSSFSGATTVTSGTLRIGVLSNALGTSALALNGGNLQTNTPGATLTNNFTVDGAATINGSSNFILSGTGTLNSGSLSINNTAGTITLSGNLSGTAALNKSGAGSLTISGADNSSFSGATTLTAGTLRLAAASNVLGSSALELNGGSLTSSGFITLTNNYTMNGNVDVGPRTAGNGLTLSGNGNLNSGTMNIVIGNGAMTISGNLTGSGAISTITNDNNALIISSNDNSGYSGTITAGCIQCYLVIDTSAPLALGTGNLIFQGSSFGLGSTVPVTITNNYTVNGTGVYLGYTSTSNITMTGAGTINPGATLRHLSSGSPLLTISGNLSGTGTLDFTDNTLINSPDNSGFSGTVIIGGLGLGIHQIGVANNAYGTGTIQLSGNIQSTLSSDTVTLNNDFIVTGNSQISGANNITMNGAGTLGGGTTLTVANTAGVISLTGALSSSGAITKSGAGTLSISNSNSSFTGNTTITAGTLQIAAATNALGTSGTLALNGGNIQSTLTATVANPFTMGGSTTVNGSNNLTFTNDGSLNSGTLTVTNSAATNFDGILSGAATGITFNSVTGTFGLNNGNIYTGKTTLTAGTLNINSLADVGGGASALGAPTTIANGTIDLGALGILQYTGSGSSSNRAINLTASGGTIDASGSGAFTLSGGVTGNTRNLVLTGTGSATQSGAITTTTGTVSKSGTGTWTLSGANTYSGATNVTAGTLEITNSNALGGGVSATSVSNSNLLLNGTFNLTNAFTLNDATITSNTASALNVFQGAMNVSGNNTIQVGSNAAIEFDSATTGAGNLIKEGTGTLSLAFARAAYSGNIVINGGSVATDNSNGLGSAAGSITINSAGTLIFDTTLAALSFNKAITMNGGTMISSFTVGGGNSATLSASGSLNLASGTNTLSTTNPLIVDAVVSGSGALTKIGANTLTLSGINTYSGNTNINNGTLSVASSANLGDASSTNNITFNGGTLTNTGAFSTSRTVDMIGNGTINNAANLTLNGVVSGNGALTKSGASTLILANNNTYSGGTTISAGTLQIGNGGSTGFITGNVINNGALTFNTTNNFAYSDIISGSGSVTQQGSGVITLGGNNSFDGGLNINSGSLVITHENAMGSVTGSTVLSSGATLTISNVFVGGEALTINGGTFGGSGNATFGGAITLNADADISNNGGIFTLNSSLGGAHDLTLSGAGTTLLFGTVGGGIALNSVTANSAIMVGGSLIRTSGDQLYNNTVVTTNNTTFRSIGTGAQTIAFANTISGGNDVTLEGTSTGTYTFTLGGITANNVNVTAAGGSTNNVFNLNTGGTQNFNATSSDSGTVTGVATVAGNFTYSNMQNINGGSGADNFTVNGGTFGNINGGAGNNSLTGDNVVNTFNVTGANGGTATGVSGTFANIQNLNGGSNADNFVLAGGTVSGNINGGAGNNSFTGDNVVNAFTLTSANGGSATGVGGTFANIQNLIGGSNTDSFVLAGGTLSGNVDGGTGTNFFTADNVTNSWNIASANGGTVTGVGGTFANIQNLIGGSGADTFTFGAAGSLTGNINGGLGMNTIIAANNLINNWIIDDNDGGKFSSMTGSFSNIQNLTGSALTDNFNFMPGFAISGIVDGGDVIERGNSINFNNYIGTVLNLYLSMPTVADVIDAGNVYDHNGVRLANFVRVQQSIGNNVGYITLPNKRFTVSRLPGDPNPLNGMIADPFYYIGWIIGNPPPVVPSTPVPYIAPIVNQPNTNANNNNTPIINYVDPYGTTQDDDYGIINNTFTDPLLNTTTVNYGSTCSYTP